VSILPKTKVKMGEYEGTVLFQSECGDYVVRVIQGVICVVDKEILEAEYAKVLVPG